MVRALPERWVVCVVRRSAALWVSANQTWPWGLQP